MGHYTLGFSVPAFGACILFLFPRLIKLAAPANEYEKKRISSKRANQLERGFLIVTILLFLFVLDQDFGNVLRINSWLILAAAFLMVHYLSWIAYFRKRITPFGMIFGIGLMSPLYLLAAGQCMNQSIMALPCAVYGILFVAAMLKSFWPKR